MDYTVLTQGMGEVPLVVAGGGKEYQMWVGMVVAGTKRETTLTPTQREDEE
jgi:hypothetical protein